MEMGSPGTKGVAGLQAATAALVAGPMADTNTAVESQKGSGEGASVGEAAAALLAEVKGLKARVAAQDRAMAELNAKVKELMMVITFIGGLAVSPVRSAEEKPEDEAMANYAFWKGAMFGVEQTQRELKQRAAAHGTSSAGAGAGAGAEVGGPCEPDDECDFEGGDFEDDEDEEDC